MSFVVPTKSEQPTEKTRLICRLPFEKQKTDFSYCFFRKRSCARHKAARKTFFNAFTYKL